jgi:hypothetical protein
MMERQVEMLRLIAFARRMTLAWLLTASGFFLTLILALWLLDQGGYYQPFLGFAPFGWENGTVIEFITTIIRVWETLVIRAVEYLHGLPALGAFFEPVYRAWNDQIMGARYPSRSFSDFVEYMLLVWLTPLVVLVTVWVILLGIWWIAATIASWFRWAPSPAVVAAAPAAAGTPVVTGPGFQVGRGAGILIVLFVILFFTPVTHLWGASNFGDYLSKVSRQAIAQPQIDQNHQYVATWKLADDPRHANLRKDLVVRGYAQESYSLCSDAVTRMDNDWDAGLAPQPKTRTDVGTCVDTLVERYYLGTLGGFSGEPVGKARIESLNQRWADYKAKTDGKLPLSAIEALQSRMMNSVPKEEIYREAYYDLMNLSGSYLTALGNSGDPRSMRIAESTWAIRTCGIDGDYEFIMEESTPTDPGGPRYKCITPASAANQSQQDTRQRIDSWVMNLPILGGMIRFFREWLLNPIAWIISAVLAGIYVYASNRRWGHYPHRRGRFWGFVGAWSVVMIATFMLTHFPWRA